MVRSNSIEFDNTPKIFHRNISNYCQANVTLEVFFNEDSEMGSEICESGKPIKIEKLKQDKISKTSVFKTYWSKINFYKHKNLSSLTIRQSSQEEEIAPFLHSDLKEKLYYKIKNYLALK